ncbi:SWI5-dependent HO expression protein 4 [Tilletia horrida]|uniref:SWI5-dependent HO expression protein 4 n=1 Tax=Tilletia horrida TaxID=155126 RepID=A0AAN6GLU6_9BASI|nr:SWI5-dependent HO expression protein 4 [Tilletia horrida]
MARIDEVTDDHAGDDGVPGQLPSVASFSPATSETDYAAAVVALAQACAAASTDESISAQYGSQVSDVLDSGKGEDIKSAFSFISALSIVHPPTAHSLMVASDGPDLLESCFDAVDLLKSGEGDEAQLFLGAALASLVDYPPSRSELASANPRAQRIQTWATNAVTAGSLGRASVQRSQTGLYAALLLLKLAAPNPSSSGVPSDPQRAAAGRKRAAETGPAAYSLAKQEVMRVAKTPQIRLTRPARATLLAALETLAYLSILNVDSASTDFRDKLSADAALLKSLTHLATLAGRPVQAGASGSGALKRPVFPDRSDPSKQDSSVYSFDPSIATSGSELGHDVAIQYALASVFQNVCAYPAQLSSEQRQVERLRRVAAQKQRQAELKASQGGSQEGQRSTEAEDSKDDYRVQVTRSETRCTRLIDAGVVSALVSLTSSAASSRQASQRPGDKTAVKPMSRLREAIAATFSALTTRQDQRIRGRIAQQGGATALLKMSEQELERYRTNAQLDRRRNTSTEPHTGPQTDAAIDLVPLHALARMCISLDPSLLFGSAGKGGPIVAVPPLCTLFLHPSSEADALAGFEAALALTNLASVGPEIASSICKFSLAMLIDGSGRGSTPSGRTRDSLLEVLSAGVFAEDNALTRKAHIELICNLVQCEDAFKFWSGEAEDDDDASVNATDEGTTRRAAQSRLHILAAFCSPAVLEAESKDDKAREVSLSTRLAASGTLASLCSSPSACDRVLHLSKRSLNTLARLIAPVRPRESDSIQDGSVERFTEVTAGSGEEDDDDDKTAVDHAGSGSSANVATMDTEAWQMTDEEEVELVEAEDADVESYRADTRQPEVKAPDQARAQLGLRGATIAHCLIQYLCWRKEQGGDSVGRLGSRLAASGMVAALQEMVVSGMAELRVNAEEDAGAGSMKREVVRLCLESLKAWSSMGMSSSSR